MYIKQGDLPNQKNYKKGRNTDIKYIVIHYTANKGDTALNNVRYFAGNAVGASAHYFIDENDIYTSVPVTDTAYHCGGSLQSSGGHAWYKKCTNSNSIGVEMCMIDKNGDIRQETVTRCQKLVCYLSQKYDIDVKNIIRHYDVTGKMCPKPFVQNNELWVNFIIGIQDINNEKGKNMEQLEQRVKELEKKINEPVYNYIDNNLPEYAAEVVKKLCSRGILKGNEDGLGLTEDMLRILVILDRAGCFV